LLSEQTMRALPLLFLVACTNTPSDEGLAIDAHLQSMMCEGAPCTHVNIEIRRDGLYAADTTVWLSVDGEPSIEVPADSSQQHNIEIPNGVGRARIDATAGEDFVSIEGRNRLTSPFEMAASLPETVTVGSTPHLTWRAQGGAVRAATVFATKVPATRFGFLEAEAEDDGDLAIEDIFTAEGEYTIALYRTLEHDGILWGSDWQQRVWAVIDPK
jgi:hypothetical protein